MEGADGRRDCDGDIETRDWKGAVYILQSSIHSTVIPSQGFSKRVTGNFLGCSDKSNGEDKSMELLMLPCMSPSLQSMAAFEGRGNIFGASARRRDGVCS